MTMDERTWIHGVSQPLPAGERLLWSGAPARGPLARHAFHVRLVLGYFALLIFLGLAGAVREGVEPMQIVTAAATQCLLAGFVVAGIWLYAHFTAKSTVYAITDRRVVLKVGLVLPTTINIPFRLIESAECRQFRDGTGQVSLRLTRPDRIGFFHLWPHVRPWRLRYPEPMLRGLEEMALVAGYIQQAAGEDVQASVLELDATGAETPAPPVPPTTHLRPIVGAHG
jgi:hypothetical protein